MAYRRVKIFASIGPASEREEVLYKLLSIVDGVRSSFSHDGPENWERRIRLVREIESRIGKPIPYMGDLPGPSVRIGDMKPLTLVPGARVKILYSPESTQPAIPVPSPEFFDVVEEGDIILMNDGKTWLNVERKQGTEIIARVLAGGLAERGKALVVQGKEYDIDTPTPTDLERLRFALEMGLDMIAVSYVRSAYDLHAIRREAESGGFEGFIVAKIETQSALSNLEEIVAAADYVMIARGDLGLYFGLEVVPKLQEHIVSVSKRHGKPVMIATQLLESMKENEVPTRAEVNDVYTAVREGVDSLLLTGETSIGKHPVEAAEWLSRIIANAERPVDAAFNGSAAAEDLFIEGVVKLAEKMGAKLVTYTSRRGTGLRVAKYRPFAPVIIGTPSLKNARLLASLWGLQALVVNSSDHKYGLEETLRRALETGLLAKGELVIATHGLRGEKEHMVKLLVV